MPGLVSPVVQPGCPIPSARLSNLSTSYADPKMNMVTLLIGQNSRSYNSGQYSP